LQRAIREAVATGQAVAGSWPADEKGRSLRPHLGRWVSFPLRAAGQPVGSATLLFERGSELLEDEGRALAAEFGRRASTVLENDRLYREAKEAVRAKDEVMAVLAHDMSNALFAIRLNAQRGLLRETGPSARILAAIARGAQWLLSMVGTLLDVSGLETGQFRLRQQSCDLATILEEAAGLQQPMADEHTVRLLRSWGTGLQAMVDRERMLQVLFNLLGNALKFTEAGGEVELGAEPENGFIRLWVRDTGVGLEAEQVSRIFDRGWQAHPESGGKGLGLYITKRIIEAHEGRIWAESAAGVGTRVFIRLPAPDARAPISQ
jgi:signal transduction histidine kinase